MLRLNRTEGFYCLGEDPKDEIHVAVTGRHISWAKPLPPPEGIPVCGTEENGAPPPYRGFGTLDANNPKFHREFDEFVAAFPPSKVREIQILQSCSYTPLSGIVYCLHGDDLNAGPNYLVHRWTVLEDTEYESTWQDTNGMRRFLTTVFPYLLGQAYDTTGVFLPAIVPSLEGYIKYAMLMNPKNREQVIATLPYKAMLWPDYAWGNSEAAYPIGRDPFVRITDLKIRARG
jgi:hypothetical protein